MDDPDYVEVGHFGRPHGVHGEMRLFADDLDSPLFASGSTLHVEMRGDWRELTVVECRETPDFGIAAFEEIDDRGDAERFRNLSVYVERDALPDLDDEAFYQADLQGGDVYLADPSTDDGERHIGTVGGFFDTNGANDVLVVWLGGDEDDELFVPMTEDATRELDPDGPAIHLAPLERWAPEDTDL